MLRHDDAVVSNGVSNRPEFATVTRNLAGIIIRVSGVRVPPPAPRLKPESSVDPVVMAAATVLRLQTIVSREIAATQPAVVTIGSIQSGTKDNVIPDDALLKLNVRTFDEDVRAHVLAAIERIVNAEAAAAGAPQPPQITTTEHYPLLSNDPAATARVAAALRDHFGDERVRELAMPYSASEDFGSFGTEWGVPSVFWYVGGTDRDLYARAQRPGGSRRTSPPTTTRASPP